ncbi:neprilysin-1-like [Amblyomma americanum]
MTKVASKVRASESQGDVRKDVVKATTKEAYGSKTWRSGGESSSTSSSSSEAAPQQPQPYDGDQRLEFRYEKPRWRRYARCALVATGTTVLICLGIPAWIRSFIGCQQPTCQSWIQEMSQSIDVSKKPCDDFYDYVCGHYSSAAGTIFPNAFLRLQVRVILAFYKRVIIQDLDAMRDKEGEDSPRFKAIYMSQRCLHETFNGVDRLDKLKDFMAGYNLTWPPNKDKLPTSLFDTLVELSLKRDVNVLFHLQPDKNFNQPGFYMLHWELNLEAVLTWSVLRTLLASAGELHDAFVRSATLLAESPPDPRLIGRVIDLDNRFLTVTALPLLALRTRMTLDYVKISDAESVIAPKLTADRLLHAINRLLPADRQLTADDQMIVKNKFFLPFVADLVVGEHSGSETVSGYVAFLLALQLAGPMSPKYLATVMPEGSETGATLLRMVSCITVPNQLLSYAMVDLFNEWFLEEGKLAAIRNMSANLWNAAESIIANLSWIDEETRDSGVKRIRRLGRVVGHPFSLPTSEGLREHYAFLPRFPASYASMFTAVHDASAERRLALIKATGPVLRGEDPEQPMILVNAFYLPIYHWVFIMDAIMFAPFYELSVPESVNYGALGHVVGHEVTHGFDPVLGVFNESGQQGDWWSSTSRKVFDERVQCLRDLYNRVSRSTGHRYGDTALSENFADCGGMEKVLRAFRSLGQQPEVKLGEQRFTAEQAFFVSSCFKWCEQNSEQPTTDGALEELVMIYSPLRMRCNVPLMNTPAFSEAFSCAEGAPMNPELRCELF